MNKLVQGFANMPGWAKIGAIVAAILGVLGVLALFRGTTALYVVLAGLVFLGLLLLGYKAIREFISRRKAAPMERSLASNAAMAPLGITEPARRARLDDLRKNFDTGVEKFRAAGKNLYALPWYALVGEPGSGKTEAIRHCNVGFPPGLQDQLQGVGGTLNMNWWFTNHAVILDTAGRLLFEEVEPGTSSEWLEFLKLLKKNRPNCPINGLLLVIPAESLIRDTAEALEKKGGRIAQQLDSIQRTLGVRFPVFVLITKCDLINGFREFFDEITDPALQHQILGWSNPSSLDHVFNPEQVEEHLRTVQERLVKRRSGLLLDPVNTEDPKKPRTNQVDALYAFPDAIMKIAPRLKRYLEMIFVAGEWSQKPLFLRGIYFTSSMREGSVLDQELAEAFGVPVESLPEGKVWERDRAFFLRDLFMTKVFREKGLVTRAASCGQQQRKRSIAVYGTAAAGLLAVGVFTWLGARGLGNTIVNPSEFWTKAGAAYMGNIPPVDPGMTEHYLPIVSKTTRAEESFKYRGGPGYDALALAALPVPLERRTRAGMMLELRDQSRATIAVPAVFRPVAAVLGDNAASLAEEQRRDAARILFEGSILRPIVDACKINLEADTASDRPVPPDALDQLSKLERACAGPSGVKTPLLQLDPLMRYALRGNNDYTEKGARNDIPALQEAYQALFDEQSWPTPTMRAAYRKFLPDGVGAPATTVVTTDKPTSPVQPPPAQPKPPTPPVNPAPIPDPKPAPTTPVTTAAANLKFPLAPYTSADSELTGEELAAVRASRAGQQPTPATAKLDAMLKALPTGARPEQICTISILPGEPPSLGKDSLPDAAPFVAIAPAGGKAGTPTGMAGKPEVRLTKLRAPGQAFDLRFFTTGAADAAPVATLSVPSRWGAMYLVDKFKGQPRHTDNRRTWDVEVDVPASGATKSVWLRLEFDADLPDLPWY